MTATPRPGAAVHDADGTARAAPPAVTGAPAPGAGPGLPDARGRGAFRARRTVAPPGATEEPCKHGSSVLINRLQLALPATRWPVTFSATTNFPSFTFTKYEQPCFVVSSFP